MTIDLNLLTRINNTVNDAHSCGDTCQIDIGDGVYDCENYAYDKRELLLKAGVPAHQMVVIPARLPNQEEHAVLIVFPDVGEPWALDNRFSNVGPMSNLIDFQGYVFLGGTVINPYTGKYDWARAIWLSEHKQ